MRFPRLVLHARAFALPGALNGLWPSANDERLLADLGLVRTADGRIVPAPKDEAGPQRAA